MRVLFIHQNFPGQFQYLAGALGALPRTTTLFLSERQRREIKIPGVRNLIIPPAKISDSADAAERELLLTVRRGACTANTLLRLSKKGFKPDIVCMPSGGGHALYVADVFPDAFRAVYADWFYLNSATNSLLGQGQPRSPANFAPARARNWCQYNALADCDFAFTFTQWQLAQFPACLAERIQVVHQGVDTRFFSPQAGHRTSQYDYGLPENAEVVTFSGRSLEPFRGFGQFAKSISTILQARPLCHVLIMSGSNSASSGQEKTVLPEALAYLTTAEQARVHYLGFRPYEEYRTFLRSSTVHVYLTAPFALSSGLFEAMSCGCLVLGADTAPVREVIRHGENGFLCDFWDSEALSNAIVKLLETAPQMRPIRDAARRSIVDGYDTQKQGPRLLELLLGTYESWKMKRTSEEGHA